jgi:hypothetical protein
MTRNHKNRRAAAMRVADSLLHSAHTDETILEDPALADPIFRHYDCRYLYFPRQHCCRGMRRMFYIT